MVSSELEVSLRRGFHYAILFGIVGTSIPLAVVLTHWFIGYLNSPYETPPGIDWYDILGTYGAMFAGCGLIAFLAAVLNYTPAIRMGFVRALLFVSVYALVGLLVSGAITAWFGLYTKSNEWGWITSAIAIVFPVFCTAAHTWYQCIKSKRQAIQYVSQKPG